MLKTVIALLITLTLANSAEMGLKGGGCSLSQEGDISLNFNNRFFDDVNYNSKSKSGKNFREILIGSVISADNGVSLKIVDYKPNKRIKGKPKTGIFIVEITKGSATHISTMSYIFDSGILSATGIYNNTAIGFWTKIKYTVCSANI